MTRYHLRRKDKALTDDAEIKRVLKAGKYLTIALCRENAPYITTMNYGFDEEKSALYFHCAKEGLKIDFIHQNPAVCATVVRDLGYREGKCNHLYQTLIIRGKLMVVEDPEEKIHGIEILLHHLEKEPDPIREKSLKDKNRYQTTGVLRMDIEDITGKQAIT